MVFDKYQSRGAYHHAWMQDDNFMWYRECVEKIVKFCRGDVADCGGGDGVIAQKIIENGHYATVLDDEPEALAICQKLDIPADYLDLNTMQLPDRTFEYMACLNTIEHLDYPPKGLLNLFEKCITKAAIIITDEAIGSMGQYHTHEYKQQELKELFKAYKSRTFRIESTEHGKPIAFIGIKVYKND